MSAVGFYHPPALAFISREADAPSKGFAYHGIGANLGIGIGPILITVGLAITDWRTVLALLAVPLLGFGVLFAFRGPADSNDHSASEHSLGDVVKQLHALGILSGTAVIVVGLVFGALLFTLAPLQSSLVTKHTPDAGQGIGFDVVFTVNFGIGALGASLAGWILSSSSYSLLFGVLALFPLVAATAVLLIPKVSASSWPSKTLQSELG